MINNIFPLYN